MFSVNSLLILIQIGRNDDKCPPAARNPTHEFTFRMGETQPLSAAWHLAALPVESERALEAGDGGLVVGG